MIRFAIFILAAVQLAAGDPRPPGPPIYTYSSELDRALPQIPSGFVRTLSFSFAPDEQWFAVLVGARATDPAVGPAIGSTLLLVPFLSSDSRPVRVDVGMPVRSGPFWSPNSEAIAVQGASLTKLGLLGQAGIPKVYNLRGEELWRRPEAGAIVGFIAPDRLLAYHLDGGKPAGIDTVNIQTAAPTPWALNPHWKVAAIDPNSRLVAVFSDAEKSKTLIVDYATTKTLQSLKNQTSVTGGYPGGFPWEYFAENGKAICSVESAGEYDTRPECREVDTGKTIARFQSFQGGAPADVSTRSTRMVLTDLNLFPNGWGVYTFKGRVVWDFRTGSEVAAWGPPAFQVTWLARASTGIPLVAISATGRYIAERLGGELRIYDIR